MGEGTKVISLADAMARIEALENLVRDLLEIEHADVFSLRADIDLLNCRMFAAENATSSATQVAEDA